ncbi:MAG: helix-turn-helix domain-containing protein [Rhodospirillales bacterium]|nr:helix-turn-helix domain-containing protein [Rhodospirillales bacterium]
MNDDFADAAPQGTPSLSRALAVLDLFDAEHPTWTAEAIGEALRCSAPTGYRYIRELLAAGLLRRLQGGVYALGPRIILLDYTMRQADPYLGAAVPEMGELARRTGCDCVMTALFGQQFLDTHRETGAAPLTLAFGRGRPRPAFLGAAPKVILSAQPTAWLRKFHDAQAEAAAAAGLGADWKAFRSAIAEIRRRGHYVSRGELEPQLSSVAVPLPVGVPDAGSALALVAARERFELMNLPLLVELLRGAAERIVAAVEGSAGAPSARPRS